MEEILDAWDVAKKRPQFKAEYMITHNIVGALEAAARAAAARLKISAADTEKLVSHYLGYTRPLSGPGVKPVPPFLFVISKDSRDHSPEVYREVIIPMFAAMTPAPRTHVLRMGAGVHTYTKPEHGLPIGIAPAAAQFYHDAITGGFFVVLAQKGKPMRPKIGMARRQENLRHASRSRSKRSRAAAISRRQRGSKSISCRSAMPTTAATPASGASSRCWSATASRATIDVNGLAVQKWPDAVKALHDAGNEIAGHGTTNDIHMTDLIPTSSARKSARSTVSSKR